MICINVMTTALRNNLSSRRRDERNPEKTRARHHASYKKNSEKVNARSRIRQKAHPEKYRAYARAAYKANPEKALAATRKWGKANPERVCEGKRTWQKANPEKCRAGTQRRKARKLGNGGSFTAEQFIDLCNFYGNICLGCGLTEAELPALGRMLVPDHVIPLAPPHSGSNDISNIQPLCHSRKRGSTGGCNNRKGAKYIDYRPPIKELQNGNPTSNAV